jgi:riboflavin biosynthesis pyrimidine reductase
VTDPVPRVDRLWPDPAGDLALDDAMAGFSLPAPPSNRPLVGVNMVTSIDGRAQLEGTAEGLAGRADRLLMRRYRAAYDAVGSGAGTLRAAGLWLRVGDEMAARREAEGRERNPVGVVVAGSEPVPLDARWFGGDERRILVVGRENPIEAAPDGTELVRASDARPAPRWILSSLAARGIRTFLLEGGPHLNAAFLEAGFIDELYWTVGAHLLGTDALPMIAAIPGGSPHGGDPYRGRLVSILRHGDELFLRYRFGSTDDRG